MNNRSLKKYFEGFAPLYREVNYKKELKLDLFICIWIFLVAFVPIDWFLRDLYQQGNVNYVALTIIVFFIFFFGDFIKNCLIYDSREIGRAEGHKEAYLENAKREAETNPAARLFLSKIDELKANKKMDTFFSGKPWEILLEDEK